ncbi:hypothetical protein B9Z55_028761 [Caenorhabditis nigoni]|uniref:Secreted protein n=1 Tax=Caenorhabditis nigoni TaxID=1611254 RepID=A0A2G5SAM0_9PELO|nr:hypothetical protein B9Z55_028761 [Caenorhabditis nigoni]
MRWRRRLPRQWCVSVTAVALAVYATEETAAATAVCFRYCCRAGRLCDGGDGCRDSGVFPLLLSRWPSMRWRRRLPRQWCVSVTAVALAVYAMEETAAAKSHSRLAQQLNLIVG